MKIFCDSVGLESWKRRFHFLQSSSWIVLMVILHCCTFTTQEAQMMNVLMAGKRFFFGGQGNTATSYYSDSSTPSNTYGGEIGTSTTTTKKAPRPPSYSGSGGTSHGEIASPNLNFKTVAIPVPVVDFGLPSPLAFKEGALRSKGRIAAGILLAKAGLLRTGANILSQKADALDSAARQIPKFKQQLINKLKGLSLPGVGSGGGSSYGVPISPTYEPSAYGRPPVPSTSQPSSYNTGSKPNMLPSTINNKPSMTNSGDVVDGTLQSLVNTFNSENSFTPSIKFVDPPSFQQNVQRLHPSIVGNTLLTGSNMSDQQQQASFNISNNSLISSYKLPMTLMQQNRPGGAGSSSLDMYGIPQAPVISSPSGVGGISSVEVEENDISDDDTSGLTFTLDNSGGIDPGLSSPLRLGGVLDASRDGIRNQMETLLKSQKSFSSSSFGGNNNMMVAALNDASLNKNNMVSVTHLLAQLKKLKKIKESKLISSKPSLQLTEPSSSSLTPPPPKPSRQGFKRTKTKQSCSEEESNSIETLSDLLTDIFMGHEMIPDVIDQAPRYPLDLTYKTVRTYPGMHVTAETTKVKPTLRWPSKRDKLYTVVMSNLDINNRKNRTLSEFWHWFVANVPQNSIDNGETIFEHLFPLVLPEGDGDHRFGYFVFEQSSIMDYSSEGGPTNACSPTMSAGRGPFRSTKNFQKKYNLKLIASTFLIIDYSIESMKIACDWQDCIGQSINLVSPLNCDFNTRF